MSQKVFSSQKFTILRFHEQHKGDFSLNPIKILQGVV